MLRFGAGRSRRVRMRIQQDHVSKHICFTATPVAPVTPAAPAAFKASSQSNRVPRVVQESGFVGVVK